MAGYVLGCAGAFVLGWLACWYLAPLYAEYRLRAGRRL